MPSATISLPRVSSVAWAFLESAVTFIIGFFVGLATSHVCPHEPGATAFTDWLGIAFSTDWWSTDDLGQGVGEGAQK